MGLLAADVEADAVAEPDVDESASAALEELSSAGGCVDVAAGAAGALETPVLVDEFEATAARGAAALAGNTTGGVEVAAIAGLLADAFGTGVDHGAIATAGAGEDFGAMGVVGVASTRSGNVSG